MPAKDHIELGRVIKPHGIRGEVRLLIHNPNGENLRPGVKVLLGNRDTQSEHQLMSINYQAHPPIAQFSGIDSRDGAEGLRGKLILMLVDDLKTEQHGERYLFRLKGYTMCDRTGELGRVEGFVGHGGQFFWRVLKPSGQELLIPLCEEWIVLIDDGKKNIVLDLPEGLSDLNG